MARPTHEKRPYACHRDVRPDGVRPQAASPGQPDEIGVIACPHGKSQLRVIRGTLSPRKHYAIAWATEDGSTGSDYELIKHDDYSARFADGERPTFLVRLSDGKALTKVKGGHLGDQGRYNPRIARAVWSADERWVAALYDGKWETDAAQIFRLGAGGASQPLDLMKLCADAERDYFKRAPIRSKFESYSLSADVKSIGDDAIVHAQCAMQVIKEDDTYSFALRLKLGATANTLSAKIEAIRLCKDDESEGDCAPMDVPE
jgi:hypothetical protein